MALAVWAGIVAGFGELIKVSVDRFYSDFTFRSRDALWMIPTLDAALFAITAVVVLVIGRWVRVPGSVAAGLFAAMAAALPLLLIERLHPASSLIVAAGVGTQTTRLLQNRVPAALHLVRRTLPWLAGLVGVLGALSVGWRAVSERLLARARPDAAPGSPNVLVLLLDTVRGADLSLYGYPRRTTPELQRLAELGIVFDLAFAPSSWTLPSHASLFTGRPEFELEVDWRTRLAGRWPTLAEVLRARGYATAGFVANTEYANWESGLGRGFEHYDDYPVTLETAVSGSALGKVIYPRFRRLVARVENRVGVLGPRLPVPDSHRSAAEISDAFLTWLDRTRPAPFFAFLNFMEAHDFTPRSFDFVFRSRTLRPISRWASWDPPPVRLTPADLRGKQDAYDGAIAYLDSQLGNLFRELDRRQLLNHTLVIVTSDHGEEFAEHGLTGHGHSLYRASLGVPLIIWLPGRVPEGRRVAAPVSLRNLAATVLELVDSAGPAPLPGRSLARFWTGGDTAPDTIVASVPRGWHEPDWYPTSRGDLRSVAFDDWRYIRNEGDGAEELYDFKNDLLERWNLVGTPEGDRLLPRYRAAAAAHR